MHPVVIWPFVQSFSGKHKEPIEQQLMASIATVFSAQNRIFFSSHRPFFQNPKAASTKERNASQSFQQIQFCEVEYNQNTFGS